MEKIETIEMKKMKQQKKELRKVLIEKENKSRKGI